MEKRLPLALVLSVLVMLAWSWYAGRNVPEGARRAPGAGQGAAETAPAAGAPAAQAPQPAVAPPEPPQLGERIAAEAEEELRLQVGVPGQPGSYLAVFSNRGALVRELRLGNYYDRVGLSEAEKLDPEHWTPLAITEPLGLPGTGSLALRTVPGTPSEKLRHEPLDQALWRMRELPADATDETKGPGVEFELAPGSGVLFRKRVRFQPGTYRIQVEIELENQALEAAESAPFLLTPVEVVPPESGDPYYQEPQAIAAGRASNARAGELPDAHSVPRDDGASKLVGDFKIPVDSISFGGAHNKYFALLLHPKDPRAGATLRGATWRRLRNAEWAASHPAQAQSAWHFVATDLLLRLQIPERGQSASWSYVVYAGPKNPDALVAAYPDFEKLVEIDRGFFKSIATALLAVLGFFERVTGNWGVAVILLTLLVRALLFPVNRRSQTAMARYQKKMKRVQPQIEELKKRYASNPQKLRQEQAALMQKEGAFPPLGGCLPVFVQIPIFFGLFQALRTSFDLRQAPFALWITDLAKPDAALELDFNTHLPFIGTIQYLNVLPILMVVLWVLQQKTMPKPADEQAARMQKMMMFMPVFMGFFLYNYAAGLSLYMITQSVLGIAEQTIIKRHWPVDDVEPPKKTGGFMARLAEKQKEQMKRLQQREARKRAAQKKRVKSVGGLWWRRGVSRPAGGV
jgi:YidC/Oxa1 family membrane protein insertase